MLILFYPLLSHSLTARRFPMNWKRFGTTLSILLLPLLLTHCLITQVQQPTTVTANNNFPVIVTIKDDIVPETNPNKGVLCVQVPTDWSFVSGSYVAQQDNGAAVGTGTIELAPNWADSATTVLPPPAGYKWIGLLSSTGYTYSDTIFVDATGVLKAGAKNGTYNIGYLTTKNSTDLIAHFADAWSDTAMNNRITVTGGTSVEERSLGVTPQAYGLSQNYPNPFNPSTAIRFDLKDRSTVRLAVFDVTGREVQTLVNGIREAGSYEVTFNPDEMSSGIYFYRLQTGDYVKTMKMVYSR
jgi:hypothetical protein